MNVFSKYVVCFAAIFLLKIPQLQSQEIFLKGEVVDSETSLSIPYAHLSIVGSGIGTYSNMDGYFELKISEFRNERLKVSAVGYEPYLISLETLNLSQFVEFRLKPATVILDGVVVISQREKEKINAKKVVQKAFKKLDESTPTDLKLHAFYRQIHYVQQKADTQYLKLKEAAIEIYRDHRKDHFNFLATRESLDLRDEEWLSRSEGGFDSCEIRKSHFGEFFKSDYAHYRDVNLTKLDVNDYLRWTEGFNSDFVKNHHFKFERFDMLDGDLVYVIKVLPNANSPNFYKEFGRKTLIPLGRLIIREKDWGILEVEYAYVINPVKKNKANFYYQAAIAFAQGDILYKDVIRYRDFEGGLVLSYLSRDSRDNCAGATGIGNLLQNTAATDRQYMRGKREAYSYYRIQQELFVNQVENSRDHRRISGTSNLPTFSAYDEEFWSGYNILPTNELDRKHLSELISTASLDQQFRIVKK